jgi:DNA replication protein DnaC
MKQIGFIQELEQLYRMGKQLPDEWQQKHNEAMRKNYQTNYERGTITREEYQEYMLELDGGACPVCGKESMLTSKPINYRETKNGETAVIEMGRYYYYQPECSCLNQSAAQKRKASEIQKRMHEAGIPKTYHDSTFQDWDYSVDDGLNSAMRKCSQLTSQEGLQDFIGRGALLFGDVGRGKTKCGIAMMRRLMEETPMKCVYEQMAGFTGKIIKSGKERRYIDDMMMFDIIMLDDLDKLSTASTWVQAAVSSAGAWSACPSRANRPSYQVAVKTCGSRSPGMCCQISSAVKLRMGASQRLMASTMWYIAVWQERRARLSAWVVYWRSLMTSR